MRVLSAQKASTKASEHQRVHPFEATRGSEVEPAECRPNLARDYFGCGLALADSGGLWACLKAPPPGSSSTWASRC